MNRWTSASVYLFAFCGGIISHRFFDNLMPLWFTGSLLVTLIVLSLRRPEVRIIAIYALGLAWANLIAMNLMEQSLDNLLEKKDIEVIGTVLGVPLQTPQYTRFDFKVAQLRWNGKEYQSPGKIRLKSYHDLNGIAANQSWRFTVRLKKARGQQNPGARFNYETWLFQNRIRATGYIRNENSNALLSASASRFSVSQFREQVAHFIGHNLKDYPNHGILTALVVGVRSAINEDQWRVLQNTGTIHLIAISGLHIGLIAGIVMWLAGHTWRLTGQLQTRIPTINIAVMAGFIAGLGYAVLAGMTIPTRRAVIMLTVVGFSILLRRKLASFEILLLALGFVLAVDPLTPLAPGFWLSFAAVAIIVVTIKRMGIPANTKNRSNFRRKIKIWVVIQLALSLGMLPLLLVIFNQISLASPLANLIAIPVIGFFAVPVGLIGLVLFSVGLPELAIWFFKYALSSIDLVWIVLQFFSDSSWSVWHAAKMPNWILLSSAIGILLIFLKAAVPGRMMAAIWFLPLIFYQVDKPGYGEFRYIMHDVGQGLSSVIETRNHTLVYDTGPHFPGGLDSGKVVMLPYLHARDIEKIDTVVISHEHNDHSGGYLSVRDSMTIDRTLSGNPGYFENEIVEQCSHGQSWVWDGVTFKVLWPFEPVLTPLSGNNASCVIQVGAKAGSILLTGDIEGRIERKLVATYGQQLKSDILQAPHQGSKTSSTAPFISSIQPDYALISSGYLNQFGHPHQEVIQQYSNHKINTLNTAHSGAIIVDFLDQIRIKSYKDYMNGYWYNR